MTGTAAVSEAGCPLCGEAKKMTHTPGASTADMLARCERITAEMKQHQDALEALSLERAALITVLTGQRGMTTRMVGAALGISGPRVTQILNLIKWGGKTGGSR